MRDSATAPPSPAKVASENHLPPGEMVGETQSPPAEMVGENQPPPAEMEGEDQSQPLPACVSKVLDDDDLLAEIVLRVGFPTSLVRAAAVCRRWLKLASDRAFLRRFRKLHPPSLLGFYLEQRTYLDPAARFFPMLPQPPPPELAAVVRRSSFSLNVYGGKLYNMVGCWNGRAVSSFHLDKIDLSDDDNGSSYEEITFGVHSPLWSKRGMAFIPPLHLPSKNGSSYACQQLFSKEEGDAVSYFYIYVQSTREEKSVMQVFILQNGDDAWCTHLTFTVDYLIYTRSLPSAVLIDHKIYMASSRNEIVVLDLTASILSTIQLPQEVDSLTRRTTMLSRADDASAFYFIHVKELQLHIWLHKEGNWLLVDNICLRQMCAPFLEAEPTALLQINHEGDYTAEFLFLQMGRFVLYLDVKRRMLRKVYKMTKEDGYPCNIYPFMMIWPPIFPVLKDGPASNAT